MVGFLSGFFTLTLNDVVFFDAALKGSVLAFGAGCEPSKRVIYFALSNRGHWDGYMFHTGRNPTIQQSILVCHGSSNFRKRNF